MWQEANETKLLQGKSGQGKQRKSRQRQSTSSSSAPAAGNEDNFETIFEQMVEEIVLPVLPEEDFSSVEDLCSSDSSSSDSGDEEEDKD